MVAAVAQRHLPLLHGLEQGRLHLGRCAVDLVGEQQVGEHGTPAGEEIAAPLVVDQGADEIGRQQVGGELDALEIDRQRLGQRLDRQGLGQARDAFDQHVAAGQQTDQQAIEQVVLPDDDPPQLGLDPLQGERFALDLTIQCRDIKLHSHSGAAAGCKWGAMVFSSGSPSKSSHPSTGGPPKWHSRSLNCRPPNSI